MLIGQGVCSGDGERARVVIGIVDDFGGFVFGNVA